MTKTKAELRASIFDSKNKKRASKLLNLFGEEVELRQPTLSQITKLGKASENSKISPLVQIMVEYLYVPGTDENVFEMSDAEALMSLPTGKWLSDFNKAVEEMTGVDVGEAEKNSDGTD